MTDAVLDSSAILALVAAEPGHEKTLQYLEAGRISAVNVAEVISKLSDHGMPVAVAADVFARLGLEVESLTRARALAVGELRTRTASVGLSLGDRSCLALAGELGLPAVTADRRWATLDVGVDVVLIR